MTERGGPEQGGSGWTYVMVTDRRLRWVPRADLRFEASLNLDEVIAATERGLAHRYAIALAHSPIKRLHVVPAHRFLMFRWATRSRNSP